MRNILIAAFLSAVLSLSFVPQAFSAAVDITSKVEKAIEPNITRYIYTLPDVALSTTTVFKIPTLKYAGTLDEVSFESLSEDVRVWCNGEDGKSYTEQPVFDFEIDTYGYSPEIKRRDYVNMDTTQIKYQYVTVQNNSAATATGASILTIDFIR